MLKMLPKQQNSGLLPETRPEFYFRFKSLKESTDNSVKSIHPHPLTVCLSLPSGLPSRYFPQVLLHPDSALRYSSLLHSLCLDFLFFLELRDGPSCLLDSAMLEKLFSPKLLLVYGSKSLAPWVRLLEKYVLLNSNLSFCCSCFCFSIFRL